MPEEGSGISPTATTASASLGVGIGGAAVVAVIAAIVFGPAVEGKWLNKDDDVNFTNNEHNLGFGRAAVCRRLGARGGYCCKHRARQPERGNL